jgi:RND family efflux transporter MFP subunit
MRRFLLATAWIISLLVSTAGCQSAAAKQDGFGPLPVRLLKLERKPIADQDEYLASLTSRRSLTLYSQVTGYVRAIRVKPGQTVKKGDLLVEIDPRQESANLRALMAVLATRRATLDYAARNDDSSRELVKTGVIGQLDYQQKRSQRAVAEADVQAAEAQVQAQSELLSFYRIVAPTDGLIGDIPVKVGDHVSAQTRLTSVDQNNLIEAYVYVPVAKLRSLAPESTIALLTDDGKVLCEEKPSFVSSDVNVDTQSVLVKANCSNAGDLRTAQVLKARMIWSTRPGLTVPTAVVSRMAGQPFVYLARPGANGLVARQAPIQTGAIVDNDYVVTAGLEPGAEVVASSLQKIRDGMPIAPLPDTAKRAPAAGTE